MNMIMDCTNSLAHSHMPFVVLFSSLCRQVLREATLGEGVVVFVAPTKALVNQVEADLYAR
jgi:hypothetical protein